MGIRYQMLIHSTDTPLHLENRIIPLTSVDRLSNMDFSLHVGGVSGFRLGFTGRKMTSVVLRSGAKARSALRRGGSQRPIPARGLKLLILQINTIQPNQVAKTHPRKGTETKPKQKQQPKQTKQSQRPIPARGLKPFIRREYSENFCSVAKTHPRKGTETKRKSCSKS
jgi:hypothetical protein